MKSLAIKHFVCYLFELGFQDSIKNMVNTIKIEKFTGKNNFDLRHIKITDCCWALAQIGEILYDEINLQQVAYETMFVWPLNKEGTPLKEHLHELNFVLMELRNIDVKIEDEDLTTILLVSLPPFYENFVSSFSIGKYSITLEEVKSSLYFRELRLKAFRNGDEASTFELLVTNSSKGQKEKKDKCERSVELSPNQYDEFYDELKRRQVKGKLIKFDAQTLNAFLETPIIIPKGEQLATYAQYLHTYLDHQTITTWSVFSYFNLAPTSHTSDLNVDCARLIYGLVMKMDLDLGSLISFQITQIAQPSLLQLGFPVLIITLCNAKAGSSHSRCSTGRSSTCGPYSSRLSSTRRPAFSPLFSARPAPPYAAKSPTSISVSFLLSDS
ncbi:Retrovirus-related Pol polyprotein from transposon TNT 1-94 [Glycine max]|nr:Retrovirus-related Pol polyprotein from transposon TNT 1-94 [Glycine max]